MAGQQRRRGDVVVDQDLGCRQVEHLFEPVVAHGVAHDQHVAVVSRQLLHRAQQVRQGGGRLLDEDLAPVAHRLQHRAGQEHGVGDGVAHRRAGMELVHRQQAALAVPQQHRWRRGYGQGFGRALRLGHGGGRGRRGGGGRVDRGWVGSRRREVGGRRRRFRRRDGHRRPCPEHSAAQRRGDAPGTAPLDGVQAALGGLQAQVGLLQLVAAVVQPVLGGLQAKVGLLQLVSAVVQRLRLLAPLVLGLRRFLRPAAEQLAQAGQFMLAVLGAAHLAGDAGVQAGLRGRQGGPERRELGLGIADALRPYAVGRAQEVVEHVGRGGEGGRQRVVALGRHVVAVEPVEPDEAVVRVQQQLLPRVVGGDGGVGRGRLGQHDPGTERHEVGAFQHRPLRALDVDLEEVDVGSRVQAADLGQGAHRHHDLAHGARAGMCGGDGGVERRQPGALDRVQHRLARPCAQRQLQGDVARPGGAQAGGLGGKRLDVHSAPAAVVEGAGDAVLVRVLGADVDKEAALDRAECPPQEDVLEVLGVGDERHGAPVMVFRSWCSGTRLPVPNVPAWASDATAARLRPGGKRGRKRVPTDRRPPCCAQARPARRGGRGRSRAGFRGRSLPS